MNACMRPDTAAIDDRLDATLREVLPQVNNLVARVTNIEPTPTYEGTGVQLTSPLVFPDGIGDGAVTAKLFRYRDAVRLDICIDHNRVFAAPDGEPTDRRCFLNDYIASVTLGPGGTTVPTDFIRQVVAGIAAARDAVRRHNKKAQAPWNEIRVASRNEELVP